MFRHILVATDGHKPANKAIASSIKLAKKLGARLTGFHATAVYPALPFPEYALAAATLTPEMWKAEQAKRAQRILQKVEAAAAKAGVGCTVLSESASHPYEAIIHAARKAGCDLIVMASHGARGVRGLILGSETNKVLTHCKIPVLVIR